MKKQKRRLQILIIPLIFISVASMALYGCAVRKVSKIPETEMQKIPSIMRIDSETLPDGVGISIEATDEFDDVIQYTAFKMDNPLRLILDIPGIETGTFQDPIELNKGAVNVIKPIQFESNIARIEIGLNQIVPYEILRPQSNIIFIDIKNPSSMIEEAALEKPSDVLTSNVIEEEEVVETEEAEPRVEAGVLSEPEEVEAPAEVLSEAKEEIEIKAEAEAKSGKRDYLVPAIVEVTAAKSKAGKEKKKYTGKRISLDFQNASITNILRLITEVSGYNIITSGSVKGKVTLRLKNVPWDQALDIILKNGKLGMEKEGNIIRILPLNELLKEQQDKAQSKQAEIEAKKVKEMADPLLTEIIRISYADISEMKDNLESLKSERGSVTVDVRTNTLILKDIRPKLEEMKTLINTLDKRTPQVMIEARIVEINRNYTRELGIQWGGAYTTDSSSQSFPANTSVKGALTAPSQVYGGIQEITTGNYAVDLPAAIARTAGGGIGITLGNIANTKILDIQLSAMESSGKGRILSNPKITTLNNKEAVIESGRRIPYQSVSASGTRTQFVDASISLTVTPHITPDSYVAMSVEVTKDEADFANQSAGMPTIMQKKATTELLVKDGDTTVIGGLYTSKTSGEMSGIPWLNNIPVLGWLFKREKIGKDEDSELLVFITATIVTSEE
ncbi:MAG: type IV pilus secretin PilQ [Nitrospinota bacterium]